MVSRCPGHDPEAIATLSAFAFGPVRRSLAVLLLAAGSAAMLPWAPSAALARPSQTRLLPDGEPEVRVLLLEGAQLQLAAPRGAQLRDGGGRLLATLPAAASRSLQASAAGLALAGVPATEDASAAPDADPAEASAAAASLRPDGLRELWIEPPAQAADAALSLGGRRYRGRLRVLAEGGRLRVINHVGLESYLASVVGSEMPASWPQQALRAQAVAARTYALRQRRPAEPFDLRATVASQVYRGLEAETASTREAVAATRSLVIIYRGDLINAVFHSSSGGATANSGEVWSSQLPYLVSVPDFDDHSPVRQWQQPLTAEQLGLTFAEIGGVESIQVLGSTADGRIRTVQLRGPRGALQLSGAELRSRLGLKSTWVRFEPVAPLASAPVLPQPSPAVVPGLPPLPPLLVPDGAATAQPSPPRLDWLAIGRGFGHGVGMSQWGAYGLARRGEGFEQILRHFYRGVEIRPFGSSPTSQQLAGLP